jgi:hypothetical protein
MAPVRALSSPSASQAFAVSDGLRASRAVSVIDSITCTSAMPSA